MSNEEILKQAKEKARINGWSPKEDTTAWCAQEVVFSHDFAKAFWNSKLCMHNGEVYRHLYKLCAMPDKQAQWQFHLQKMVLEENPLDYLRRFL